METRFLNVDLEASSASDLSCYKGWLPQFVDNAGGDIAAIQAFRTDIFLKPNKQIAVEAHLLDDRGKEYVCSVSF